VKIAEFSKAFFALLHFFSEWALAEISSECSPRSPQSARRDLLRVLICIPGVVKRLCGEFVRSEMIPFAVSGGGRAVGVRCEVM
jgi:hypothetical protein